MQTVRDFPRPIRDIEDLAIILPDGCRLSARVWLPEDAGTDPVPAILEYIPYRKRDGTLPRDERMHPYFAGHGYAAVRVDMRGNGDSDGLMTDEYTPQELQDACDVIAWLADQLWCTGRVGMMGKSWGGFNCLQTAALNPPALGAIITVCSTTDRFADDIHFKGGCLLGENFGWGAVMLSYSSRPPDPALRQDWRELWLDRLEVDTFLAPLWARHQSRDAYWRHGSVAEDYAAIKVPVLSIGGWADNYMNTVAHLVENLDVPAKGIVGPWVHQYPHTAVPAPRIGFLQEALRWWDKWLKDAPTGVEDDPAYRAYLLESAAPDASAPYRAGVWLAESEWPSRRTTDQRLYLGQGTLGTAPSPLDASVSSPQHLGLHTGEFFPMGLDAEMPGDQAPDDAMSVCFDTAPLAAPLAFVGAARLRLRLSADKPHAFVVARLCDVAPDGSSTRICHGILNLRHRDSMAAPKPLIPGETIDVDLTLDQAAFRLATGHRLRVALSTTYWPFVWPSPEAATLTLTSGHLDLPVHPGAAADEWTFAPAVAADSATADQDIPSQAARRIEHNLLSGTHSLIVESASGPMVNADHGLVTEEALRECWSIHPDDPLSAHAEISWKQRLGRGEWHVETSVEAEMRSDRRHLHMTAKLVATEGGRVIFEREFAEKVARNHV